MKKYIGLICSAVLFVMLAAGCSGAYGFDGELTSLNPNFGGGTGSKNPFAGTSWYSHTGYRILQFTDDTVIYTDTYNGNVGGDKFDYTFDSNDNGSYVATIKKSNGLIEGTFIIASADARAGTYNGIKYDKQ